MGRRATRRVEIAGPAAGTLRAGRKANSAIFERVRVGNVEVVIRYPGLFTEGQIDAARLMTLPTARLATEIRDRMMQDERTWQGRKAKGFGHVTSGKMWDSMTVRALRNRVRVSFKGSSQSYSWKGHVEYLPELVGVNGKWNKRTGLGKFAKREDGDINFVRDMPPVYEPNGKAVPNRLKARRASDSDLTSILGYNEIERRIFEAVSGESLEAIVSDLL